MKNLIISMISIIIVFILIGCTISKAEERFKDVKSTAWYYEDLSSLLDKGIINGYKDGTFRPNEYLSGDMFIKMLITSMGYTNISNAPNYWAKSYIDKAIELEVVPFTENYNTYKNQISREDIAKIIVNVIDEKYKSSGLVSSRMKDFNNIEDKNKESVATVYRKGIITGFNDRTFRPKNMLTRTEAVVILNRAMDEKKRVYSKELTDQEITKIQGFEKKKNANINFVDAISKLKDLQNDISFIGLSKRYIEDLIYNIDSVNIRKNIDAFDKTFEELCGTNEKDKKELYENIIKSKNKTISLFDTSENLMYITNENTIILRGRLTLRNIDYTTNKQVGKDETKYLEIEIGKNLEGKYKILELTELK